MSLAIGGHHRGYRGKTDTWITPRWLVEALGPFDLDPCCPDPMPWRTAEVMFTEHGLDRDWGTGAVWMNPPYGPETHKWLGKLAGHGRGIALVFARTETKMFFDYVWPLASAVLFLKGRLTFCDQSGRPAKGNGGGPSVLIAYGGDMANRLNRSGIDGKFVRLDYA